MKKIMVTFFFGSLNILVSASALSKGSPPPTVPFVELGRYLGTWHEIARLPMFAQKGCFSTTANYSLRDDGDIRVENRCMKMKGDVAKESQATGRAWIVDEKTNSRLKVRFVWWLPYIADGDYWVLKLDKNYQISLVGTPDHKYLWLLAREPNLPKAVFEEWISYAKSLGYDTDQLIIEESTKAVL